LILGNGALTIPFAHNGLKTSIQTARRTRAQQTRRDKALLLPS
jgi:hypothetical protein